MRHAIVCTLLAAPMPVLSGSVALADCPAPGWQPGFGAPGVSSNQFTPQVNALHVWDPDGPGGPDGPVLVVGGAFITAGGTNMLEGESVNHIALWDGDTFRGMPGLNGQILAIEVDNANVLHVGGHFTSTPGGPPNALPRIARFDAGMNIWRGLAGDGLNGQVNALHVEPSGELLVGGLFTNFVSGGEAGRLVRWNGAAWSAVSWAYDGSVGAPAAVWSIFDAPDAAYRTHVGLDSPAGGSCVRAPAQPAGPSPPPFLPGPVLGRAHTGLQTPDGRLWAGGSFTHVTDPFGMAAPASRIAFREPGGAWVQAGPGFDGAVYALIADGNTVYAGGRFTMSGSTPVNNIARWDGSAWQPMGVGFDADVFALAIYNGQLYAGGMFGRLGNGVVMHGIARWDGDEWRSLGHGAHLQSNPAVTCVARFDNDIVAAGRFTEIGGLSARRVARFTGSGWEQIGQGFEDYPHAMVELDSDLYALGMAESARPAAERHRVQRFEPNGALWIDLGGFDQYFSEAIIWNDELVVGGSFGASGTTPLSYIARRDSNGNWQSMGAGFNNAVAALTIYDGDLIAGGWFTMSGTTAVNRVARWDAASQSWQPMGAGLPGSGERCDVLHVHDGELYAGGTHHGYLRRWDGASWVQVGNPAALGGCFGGVAALASYNDDLIVGGSFSCGQVGVFRWDGATYGPLAAGAAPLPNVGNLVVIGGDLWMNGVFNSAGGLPASGLVVWRDQVPWIRIEPTSLIAGAGDEVTFSVALTHVPGFQQIVQLQWLHDGVEIPGATTPELSIASAQAGDAGDYVCVMEGSCGFVPFSVESNVATLTVNGTGCPGARADASCDGNVDFFDIDPFLLALFDVPAYQAAYCGGSVCAADANCDRGVDFFDIDPFLGCLFAGCAACP